MAIILGRKGGGSGGGGGGSVNEITSTDNSVTITDPSGPTVDLSVSGGSQPVPDSGNAWEAETAVADGYRITADLADSPTGDFLGVFEVTTAGTTAVDEPTWRTGLGGEIITDDTAAWQFIGQVGKLPIAILGAPTSYLNAGEIQVGSRATVETDGVADTAQRATVYGDGTAVASLSGYAGTGAVDVDSSGTVAGDGNVDASANAQVGANGNANGRTNATVMGDGDADAYATARVNAAVTGRAKSGFMAVSDGLGIEATVGILVTADALGLLMEFIGVPEADPLVANAVWWDGDVLTRSAGP